MTSSPAIGKLRELTGGSARLTRLAAVVIAFFANAIVWLIADPIGGANLRATAAGFDDPQSVNLLSILFSMITYGIIAWIVLMLIERFSSRAKSVWLIVSLVALALTMFPIFGGSDNSATTITLIIMHLVAAAVIIPIFASTIRER